VLVFNMYTNIHFIQYKQRSGVRSVCILVSIFGITWLVGVFAVNEETLVLQYLFGVFNSIQVKHLLQDARGHFYWTKFQMHFLNTSLYLLHVTLIECTFSSLFNLNHVHLRFLYLNFHLQGLLIFIVQCILDKKVLSDFYYNIIMFWINYDNILLHLSIDRRHSNSLPLIKRITLLLLSVVLYKFVA